MRRYNSRDGPVQAASCAGFFSWRPEVYTRFAHQGFVCSIKWYLV